jgi:hypothetical protein
MGVCILSDMEFQARVVGGTCYQLHATIELDKAFTSQHPPCMMIPMAHPAPRPLTSIRDLIAKSDFARLNPGRASEILDRCSDPVTEDRPSPDIRKELVDASAR